MSKTDRAKKRIRKVRYQKPSAPRVIGANDNFPRAANDDFEPAMVGGITLGHSLSLAFRKAEADCLAVLLDDAGEPVRLRNGDPAPDLARRREGHSAMLQIEQALAAQHDAARMKAVRAEIAELERRRGGELKIERARDKRGEDGERLKVARDGLETLLTAGSITRTQHAAGLLFRADYEMLDPEKGLTPPAIDQSRNIVRGGEGFAAKRQEREAFVRDLEAMIQAEDRTFRGALGRTEVERVGRAVWALRQVAGKGANLVSLTGSGSGRAAISTGLLVALDCAAIAYGLD